MPDLSPGVPSALSPLVRRIVAPNPGPFTGPGTNTYLVGIDEVAVIDPGPDDKRHIDAIIGASMRERVRWVLLTHTHPDHAPGTARLVKATGAEVLAYGKRLDKDSTIVPDRVIGDGDTIEGTEFGLEVLHTPGHAPNHLCFLLEEERVLFTGDTVLDGMFSVVSPNRGGDMAQYLATLRAPREAAGVTARAGTRRRHRRAPAPRPGVRRPPQRPRAAGVEAPQGGPGPHPRHGGDAVRRSGIAPEADRSRRVAAPRPPAQAQGGREGRGDFGEVGVEARVTRVAPIELGAARARDLRTAGGVGTHPPRMVPASCTRPAGA